MDTYTETLAAELLHQLANAPGVTSRDHAELTAAHELLVDSSRHPGAVVLRTDPDIAQLATQTGDVLEVLADQYTDERRNTVWSAVLAARRIAAAR